MPPAAAAAMEGSGSAPVALSTGSPEKKEGPERHSGTTFDDEGEEDEEDEGDEEGEEEEEDEEDEGDRKRPVSPR